MRTVLDPFSFVVTSMAGWMNRHQQQVIEYLREENRVLREQIGNKRMRFTDQQRRSTQFKVLLGRTNRLFVFAILNFLRKARGENLADFENRSNLFRTRWPSALTPGLAV